ncbi:hypothetical protein KAX01_02145 [Candidatus Bathyarchaeota archaeon]|nr:hypothetical protein [Candidatus Bathyarchaeota archaeon]
MATYRVWHSKVIGRVREGSSLQTCNENGEALSSKKPLKVILDSNFFFIPSQFAIDIFEELGRTLNRSFEPILLSSTLTELQLISKSKSQKLQKQATIALKLAMRCRRMDVEKDPKESYDDLIFRVASKKKWCVATNDRILRRRLRKENVAVIYLRQESHLIVEGNI